jgi:type IV pilus assembly protein PilQ
MPYKRVLSILTQMRGLIYEEQANVILVKSPAAGNEGLDAKVYAPVDSREVEISAVFFEGNVRDAKERGINWEYLLSQAGLNVGTKLRTFSATETTTEGTTSTVEAPDFTVNNQSEFEMGNFTGNATAAFKFFETENLGEIIARPSVTVRDKQQGRIQIGEDISIKERDFAGNLIDKFYSTGTIIEVTPYIYLEDGVSYILLQLKVERSSGQPGQISTTIAKTSASTEVLMLDGEETVIGGLFVNTENIERRGIPFLRDLPWWVFGIRYLTGYDATTLEKREIIISVRTNILPTLKERIADKKKENIADKIRKEAQADIDSMKTVKSKEE